MLVLYLIGIVLQPALCFVPTNYQIPQQQVPFTQQRESRCLREQRIAAHKVHSGMIGVYVPNCDRNGDYDPIQCTPSTGMCWCSDKWGNALTQQQRGIPTYCGGQEFNQEMTGQMSYQPDVMAAAPTGTTCEKELKIVMERQKTGAAVKTVPECDENGHYLPIQCAADTSMLCWCSDKKGRKLSKPVLQAEQQILSNCAKMAQNNSR